MVKNPSYAFFEAKDSLASENQETDIFTLTGLDRQSLHTSVPDEMTLVDARHRPDSFLILLTSSTSMHKVFDLASI
jgi:hypothetical protein